jgi:hypothetical protein
MYLKNEVGAASGINCAHLLSRRSQSFHRRSHSGGCPAAAAELVDVDSAIGIAVDFTNDTRMDAVWQQPSLLLGASIFWSATPASRRWDRSTSSSSSSGSSDPFGPRILDHPRRAAPDVSPRHRRQHRLHGFGAIQPLES